MQGLASVVLILGAILFLTAAFMPISGRVFRPNVTPAEQIQAVTDARGAWLASSALFGLGSIVAVAGLILFARSVAPSVAGSIAFAAYASALIAGVGAIFWVVIAYNRIVDSPEQVFLGGSLDGRWMFPLYTILTQIALIAVGYVLLQAGYPAWLGWGMIVLVSLTILGMLIFRDMPPFVHYLWLLIMGVTLLMSAGPRLSPALSTFVASG